MRRQPVAVYRVIDEEELLGGEGVGALDGEYELAPPLEFGAREQPVPRRQRLGGWGSTGLALAALVGVAGLLLTVSSHVRPAVAVPAAAPPLRPTQPVRRAIAVAAPAQRLSPPRPKRRVRPAGAPRAVPRRVPRVRARSAPTAARASSVARWSDRPVPTHMPVGAGDEFGFER
jgi:hypothetical protein